MRTALLAAAITASLLIAGCSDTSTPSPQTPAESKSFNATDVQYLQAAIPAHAEAIAMARLAQEQASAPGVRLFGSQIVDAQASERDDMVRLLESWGYAVDAPLASGDGVPELTREADIRLLASMAGTAFDAQFLTSMEQHHQRVLAASRAVESSGESQELRALTDLIIRSQAFELEQIDALRSEPGQDDVP